MKKLVHLHWNENNILNNNFKFQVYYWLEWWWMSMMRWVFIWRYRYNALWLGITTEISGGKRKLTSKVVEMKDSIPSTIYSDYWNKSCVIIYLRQKDFYHVKANWIEFITSANSQFVFVYCVKYIPEETIWL